MPRDETFAGIFSFLGKIFFPVSIVVAALLLLGLYAASPGIIALQGTYLLFGLLLGAGIYYELSPTMEIAADRRHRRWATKGTGITLALSVVYTSVTGDRVPVLFIGLPVVYTFLAIQYISDQSPTKLVLQVAAAFALSPLTKYMTTEFYWGRGDLLRREGEIRSLLLTGSTSEIDGIYEFFPGLHLLTGSASIVSGIPTDDSILLSGIVAYTAVLLVVYAIAQQITRSDQLAVATVLGFSLLKPVHIYTTYFYSQAFATALSVFIFWHVFKRFDNPTLEITVSFTVLLCATIITHHFTLVLLVPLILVLATVGSLHAGDVANGSRFLMPFVIFEAVSVVYMAYRGWAFWFFIQLISGLKVLLSNLSLSDSGAARPTATALGTTIPIESIQSILLYPPFIYLVCLLGIFSVGVAVALEEYDNIKPFLSMIVAGILGAVLIFETPVSFSGLNRARLPWTLPFAFVLGLGIVYLRRTSWSRAGKIAVIGLVAVAGAAGPMAAADDLGSFSHNPHEQVAYEQSEYEHMLVNAEFSREYGEKTSSLWIGALTLRAYGATATEPGVVNESGIAVEEGLFLYRTQWTNHKLKHTTPRGLRDLYISERYLRNAIARENKVYTTADVGLTWSETERVVGV